MASKHSAQSHPPGKLIRDDTLDRVPSLSGQLSSTGIANLDVDDTSSSDERMHNMTKENGHVAKDAANDSTPESRTPDEEDIEDYDTQGPDEDALVDATRAGKVAPGGSSEVSEDRTNGQAHHRSRRKSIPIRLEKTDKKGRYMLHADDAEMREILRQYLERQKSSAQGKRSGLRDLVFTRRFTQFDRQNPSNTESPFYGFFTLFWLVMAGMLLRVAAYNYKIYGSILGSNEVLKLMFSHDVIVLGLTDGVMCASTAFGLALQKLIAKGYFNWRTSGYIIESVWQAIYVFGFIGWTFYREWPWTHTIFTVLHCLVFLMKQHSYAFYNGYLSQVYRRKQLLERKLDDLQTKTPLDSPKANASESNLLKSNGHSSPSPDGTGLRQRRKSTQPSSANLSTSTQELTSILSTISTQNQQLTPDQTRAFSSILHSEIDACTTELRGKCSPDPNSNSSKNSYPHNLTLSNFADWTILPTLVYELEYPRQQHTNWWYVAEKTSATFGVIAVMMVISQAYIYPPVHETVRMKEAGLSVAQRWEQFPWIVSDMLFPLLLEQLLTWYVIWECVLNVLAEITGFADRGFYGPWWNSVGFDEYARDWNRPVHNFLLRHVYHSSISAFHFSKSQATFATFFLSACVHELLMFCLFKKVRGYLFAMQILQVPLVALSRTSLLKGRRVLGNVVFWVGLFVGPSFLSSLYLVV
ncbi:MAG: acyl-CoA/sterol acyltransferase [Alyxoria varia]|nr:MAG: acyl-CoA/sterol acyltransferase [Alyxoria varia]